MIGIDPSLREPAPPPPSAPAAPPIEKPDDYPQRMTAGVAKGATLGQLCRWYRWNSARSHLSHMGLIGETLRARGVTDLQAILRGETPPGAFEALPGAQALPVGEERERMLVVYRSWVAEQPWNVCPHGVGRITTCTVCFDALCARIAAEKSERTAPKPNPAAAVTPKPEAPSPPPAEAPAAAGKAELPARVAAELAEPLGPDSFGGSDYPDEADVGAACGVTPVEPRPMWAHDTLCGYVDELRREVLEPRAAGSEPRQALPLPIRLQVQQARDDVARLLKRVEVLEQREPPAVDLDALAKSVAAEVLATVRLEFVALVAPVASVEGRVAQAMVSLAQRVGALEQREPPAVDLDALAKQVAAEVLATVRLGFVTPAQLEAIEASIRRDLADMRAPAANETPPPMPAAVLAERFARAESMAERSRKVLEAVEPKLRELEARVASLAAEQSALAADVVRL